MQCVKPILLRDKKTLRNFPEGLLVPCGKCITCRIAKRREWSIRMFHELHYHEDSVFITLTYDDEHLPPNGSLVKKDLQKFFKRLRRDLDDSKIKIKYFACGEYGEKTKRPHYHAIIFGLGLNENDRNLIMDNWPFCDWSNQSIRKNSFGLVETYSIQYVAGYIHSKLNGDEAEREYKETGREPVFRLLSLGLGAQFVDEFKDELTRNQCFKYRGKEMSLPRYYVNRLGLTTDDLREKAIELDCDFVEDTTGIYIHSDVLYHSGEREMMRSLIERTQGIRKQRERNAEAKLHLKDSKL